MGKRLDAAAARSLGRIGVATAALVAGACSLILNWDPDGLPCGTSKDCATGYSCMVKSCVADGSIPLGETCSEEQQCEGAPNVTCGSTFTCSKRCRALFQETTACGANQYCRPELNTGAADQAIGTCVDSECTDDQDCRESTCVPVTSTARACLQECAYYFDSSGAYRDRCEGTSGGQQLYCQPIGPSGQLTFVCLDLAEGTSRQWENGVCDPVLSPCESGTICHDGLCYRLCDNDGNQCRADEQQQICKFLPGDSIARICDPPLSPNP